MKRYAIVLIMLLVAAAYAQRGGGPGAPALPGAGGPAQGPPAGGRGQSPEQQAAAAAQNQLEQTPPIPFDAVSLPLMPEGHTIGETEGVALNSKKHLFVYTRSGNSGPARGAQAAELFRVRSERKVHQGMGTERLRLLLRARRESR